MEKEEIDFNLIRECLVKHAERIGRPHYDVVVVRRVLNAFVNGVDDPLKNAVESIVREQKQCNVHNRRRELIIQFCSRKGAFRFLLKRSGLHDRILRETIKSQRDLTDDHWAKVLNAFDLAENDYREWLDERA